MCNLYFNIRFGSWFLQIGKDSPYISIAQSDYWVHYYSSKHPKITQKWFEVYTAFGKFYN